LESLIQKFGFTDPLECRSNPDLLTPLNANSIRIRIHDDCEQLSVPKGFVSVGHEVGL
jgi:hypothetical protein